MSAILIERGDLFMGMTRTDKDGNVVENTGARWEPNAEGGCVAIFDVDTEKMEPIGTAEAFGDWDAAHFLALVLEKLGPGRATNVPDFRDILRRAVCDGADEDFFCEYCQKYGYDCRDCIVNEWKEDFMGDN